MTNDVVTMIRDKRIAPFCQLSERGLQAAFSGLLGVVRLARHQEIGLASAGEHYLSVLRGGLRILGPEGRHTGESVRSRQTAASPYVFRNDRPGLRVRATDDTLFLQGACEAVDDLVAIDTLAREQGDPIDVLLLVLMRAARSFAPLSLDGLFQVYRTMGEVAVAAGTEVVRQDTRGDRFYFIREGAAEVWQENWDDDAPRHVATLDPGDGFGEEALIIDGARNATVRMLTPGRLMTLEKAQYLDLISSPSIHRVSVGEAAAWLESGACLIDVRYADEWEEGYIPGAVHIPLTSLRARAGELDKGRNLVVYCRSGRRSQVGAILLAQMGFRAASMDGGILEWPGETVVP